MTTCACGRTFLCDPRDCKALRDRRRRELAEYEKREVAPPPIDRAKIALRFGDKVRFRDWRRPSVLQEGEVVGIWPASPTPHSAYVQRADYHDRFLVFYYEIVEVVAGEANSKAKEV